MVNESLAQHCTVKRKKTLSYCFPEALLCGQSDKVDLLWPWPRGRDPLSCKLSFPLNSYFTWLITHTIFIFWLDFSQYTPCPGAGHVPWPRQSHHQTARCQHRLFTDSWTTKRPPIIVYYRFRLIFSHYLLHSNKLIFLVWLLYSGFFNQMKF